MNFYVLLTGLTPTVLSRIRSKPQWRCYVATARWRPTATAPVTARSQTTSSSACPVSGRTQRRTRPFSSKSWTTACWISGTCATEPVLRLPNGSMVARVRHQGSKTNWKSTAPQAAPLSKRRLRLSSWDACVCLCCLCGSVPLRYCLKDHLYYLILKEMWFDWKLENFFFIWGYVDNDFGSNSLTQQTEMNWNWSHARFVVLMRGNSPSSESAERSRCTFYKHRIVMDMRIFCKSKKEKTVYSRCL